MSIAQREKVLDKIRTRGYWRVVIRPSSFKKNHIANYVDLFPIIRKNSVQIRGWDYPHIDQQLPPRHGADWIDQKCEFEHHIEVWRIYKSGLFVHYFAMFGEWRDQSRLWPPEAGWEPGRDFGYVPAVYSLLEIFEFAARLAQSPAGAEAMHVDIDIHGLEGRTLVSTDQGILLGRDYQITLPEWKYFQEFTQTELIARPRELAAEASRDLFAHFEVDVSLEILARVQSKIGW